MRLISAPSIDSEIFEEYFECVWNMEMNNEWGYWYNRQLLIEKIMVNCGYVSSACFMMLCNAHDIIYDR